MKGRLFLAVALLGTVLVVSGCGSQTLDDQFVFGKNRISCANETITLEVPFEMGISGKMADLAPKDGEKVNAEGHNQYMQILVTGERNPGKTVEGEAEAAASLMGSNASVTGLQTQKDTVDIGPMKGIRLTFSFTDMEKGRSTELTVKEYIFQQKNTIWRVIYQYRTGDPVGKSLAERLEGKIVPGATF